VKGEVVVKLTRHTDYALRVLMQVALAEGGLVRITDIAESYAISRNHLTKIVHQLGAGGYLQTVQGRHGGIRLARAPESIVIGEVVRDFEEGLELVECFDANRCACRIAPACVLKTRLSEALDAFLAVLDRTTLADLLTPRRRLRTLLALDEPGPGLHPTSGGVPA